MMPVRACVGLGANLGDPMAALTSALTRIAALPTGDGLVWSSVWRTAPVDAAGPDFLNAVAMFDTLLDPETLLDALRRIESDHGRERPYRNAPRLLDLDLLLYGDRVIESARLTVPHPRMHLRAFVLAPLVEIEPRATIPGHGAARVLLAACTGQPIERIAPPAAIAPRDPAPGGTTPGNTTPGDTTPGADAPGAMAVGRDR